MNIKRDLEILNELLIPDNAITIFGSARINSDDFYYQKAKELAYKSVKEDFSIISGGGYGIMEAANLGASVASDELGLSNDEKNIKSIAFNIFLPNEQQINNFVGYNKTFKSLAIRKKALIQKSIAFVIFPGGYGTLDELLEVLTLKQLGFKIVPIFMFGKDFWQDFDKFIKNSLLKYKLINQNDLLKYELSDDIDYILMQIKDYYENFSCNERRSR